MSSNGGAEGIRTPAPVTRSNGLANRPLRPLGYASVALNIQHAGNKLHYFVRQIGKLKEKDPFIIRNNDWV